MNHVGFMVMYPTWYMIIINHSICCISAATGLLPYVIARRPQADAAISNVNCPAIAYARQVFARLRFAKNEQMLVHNKIKAPLLRLRPPPPGIFTMMLDLDNVLFQHEAGRQKSLQNAEGKRHIMPAFTRIADEYRTILVGLKNAVQFTCDYLNLITEFRQAAGIR